MRLKGIRDQLQSACLEDPSVGQAEDPFDEGRILRQNPIAQTHRICIRRRGEADAPVSIETGWAGFKIFTNTMLHVPFQTQIEEYMSVPFTKQNWSVMFQIKNITLQAAYIY